ncbi:hypothetical protein Tco_1319881 [Tanacetum coccineum]
MGSRRSKEDDVVFLSPLLLQNFPEFFLQNSYFHHVTIGHVVDSFIPREKDEEGLGEEELSDERFMEEGTEELELRMHFGQSDKKSVMSLMREKLNEEMEILNNSNLKENVDESEVLVVLRNQWHEQKDWAMGVSVKNKVIFSSIQATKSEEIDLFSVVGVGLLRSMSMDFSVLNVCFGLLGDVNNQCKERVLKKFILEAVLSLGRHHFGQILIRSSDDSSSRGRHDLVGSPFPILFFHWIHPRANEFRHSIEFCPSVDSNGMRWNRNLESHGIFSWLAVDVTMRYALGHYVIYPHVFIMKNSNRDLKTSSEDFEIGFDNAVYYKYEEEGFAWSL